jgi:hypothetical protein
MKYAALITKSVTIPGDERSRTHPGHGYPEHSQEYLELRTFEDKAAMEAWVKQSTTGYNSYSRPTLKLIQYEELNYETTVSVKVTP